MSAARTSGNSTSGKKPTAASAAKAGSAGRKPRQPRIQIVEAEDALPEADRLEGFAHPRETLELFGHTEAEHELLEGFRSGRIHHAWLLTGQEGIGKATLAWRFARFVLAYGGEADLSAHESLEVPAEHRASHQLAALAHPGLLLLRRPYDLKTKRIASVITVDEVRRLRSFLGHASGDGGWRIVIVDRVEEANANAANALLKSLEEPPKRTIFLLVSSEPGRLLPTIHSRCRQLALKPLGADDLSQAVQAALEIAGHDPIAPDQAARLAELAEGSVRKAIVLSAIGGLDLYDTFIALLQSLPNLKRQQLGRLADKLAPVAADQAFEAFFDLAMGALGRIVRHGATGSGGIGAEAAVAERLVRGASGDLAGVARWAELWETLGRDRNLARAINLDRKALILNTFFKLEAAARRPM